MTSRRDVLKLVGGAFLPNVVSLVPMSNDPKAQSLDALLNRTSPEIFSGNELKYVGMPIGGCFAGTVYLGGDGHLWNWDILNQVHEGSISRQPVVFLDQTMRERDGANYVESPQQTSAFEVQFYLDEKPLDHRGGWNITFCGQYPVGTVTYANDDYEVTLTAFSPFIPLEIEQSSFPAVAMDFSVKAKKPDAKKATLMCVFEHPGMLVSEKSARGKLTEEKDLGEWKVARAFCDPSFDKQQPDFGDFCVATKGGRVEFPHNTSLPTGRIYKDISFHDEKPQTGTFVLTWHFPNVSLPGPIAGKKRWYAKKWMNALDVATSLTHDYDFLKRTTLHWRDTWYDSSLPHWFLSRTFINVSTLATNTCYRFSDGRYWFWEGVGCCEGTCTHVWSYAQAMGYIFPEIERSLRKDIDYGLAYRDTGAIDYRAEFGKHVATDGQCGCILRTYREHLNSPDDAFLKSVYPHAKKSMQYLMAEDKDQDGLLEGPQYNTLDAAWYGPMAWISSLFIAALRASEAMAVVMDDADFARDCRVRAEIGSKSLVAKLYNGSYFFHQPDPAHPEANATGIGCHIDQLYGQAWTGWLGLPRVVDKDHAKSAMSALFANNFFKNVWEYRKQSKVQGGRWYAMPGESGLIMTTFPRGGAERATGAGRDSWAAMYFNECMSGFEYQAASCMIAEDLVAEGLTVVRAIHDRYHPLKRNPYNEVECSDHYGRAMASFGAYLALTGWQAANGKDPSFARSKVKDLKCAFIGPKGWGTYENGKLKYAYRATKIG